MIRIDTAGPGMWLCPTCFTRTSGRHGLQNCPKCATAMGPIVSLCRVTRYTVKAYHGDSTWVALANRALYAYQDRLARRKDA